MTSAQRQRWDQNRRVKCVTEGTLEPLSVQLRPVQLEAKYGGAIMDQADANEDLTALLSLIDIRLPYNLWTPFGELLVYGRDEKEVTILTFAEARIPTEMQFLRDLKYRQLPHISRYWRTITGTTSQNQRLRRAVVRFKRARSSYFAEDAIVHAFIGLEALFADHTQEAGKVVSKVIRRLKRFIL